MDSDADRSGLRKAVRVVTALVGNSKSRNGKISTRGSGDDPCQPKRLGSREYTYSAKYKAKFDSQMRPV